MKKWLVRSGAVAALLYLASVVVLFALYPGYNHIHQPISGLMADGAPNAALTDSLFTLYNLLVGLCGLGLWLVIRRLSDLRGKRAGLVAALLLMVMTPLGILQLVYSQDLPGAATTYAGTFHITFAALSSLVSMLTILLAGLWLNSQNRLKLARYSFLSLAIVFVFGGIAAASAATASPLMGLFERITIGAYLQWLFVFSLAVARPE